MILSRISKQVLHSIPVLSIFVLLGITGFSTIGLPLAEPDGEAYAETLNTNTSLIIDNGNLDNVSNTIDGNMIYSSHTVQVKAGNIDSYSLTITGPKTITNGTTTISGAGGATPTNMADNTWGYAFAPNTANNESTLAYQSFPDNNASTTLDSNNPSVSNYAVDFTRKLVFAAKFDENAESGHYRANVELNLAVAPKIVTTYNYSVTYNANGGTGTAPTTQSYTTSDTSTTMYAPDQGNLIRYGYDFVGWAESAIATIPTYYAGSSINLSQSDTTKTLYAVWAASFPGSLIKMQDMTATICQAAGIGARKELTDARDGKSYMVQKLSDGNCWMTSNLALDLRAYTLTATTSDVTSSWAGTKATKVTTVSGWSSGATAIQYAIDGCGSSNYNYSSAYGYYYSWCAATAGTCSSAAYGSDAPSSICPKGWKLPRGGTNMANNTASSQTGNDFANLIMGDGETIGALSGYPFVLKSLSSATPKYITLGGADWYAAGYIVASVGLDGADIFAYYWSRTMMHDTVSYDIFFNGSNLYPSNGASKDHGFSVRCIAYSS